MLLRSRIGAIAIAILVTATGGSAVFGSSNSGSSSQPKRVALSKFAGTWTGPIVQTGFPDGSFKSVLDTSGNGTVDIIELQCKGTETFISFDGTTLKLRHVVTIDPLSHCVKQGTVTATLTGSNTSTWNFLGDDGTISIGTGTRAKKQGADHSCDRADAKVADLVDKQAETDTKIGKQNKQLNVLTALKTRAVTAERQALVASTDKRILKLQENIDAKKSSIESDRSDEHALEEHCGITPPPPVDQVVCADGTVHNLPFVCPVDPPPTITCPDSTVHNLPYVCPASPPQIPNQIACADGTIHDLPFTCPPPPLTTITCADSTVHNLPFTCPTSPPPPPNQISCPDGTVHNVPFTCPTPPPPPPDQIACADGTVHNLPFTCPPQPPTTITCADSTVHNLPFTCPTPPPPVNQIACADGTVHNLPFNCPTQPQPTITCADGALHALPFTCPPLPPPPPDQIACADGTTHNLPFTCPPPAPGTITCADSTVHNLPFVCPPPPPPVNQISCADGTTHNLPFTCPPPDQGTITCTDSTVHNLPFVCPPPPPPVNQISCADGTTHNLPFTCPPPDQGTITCADGIVHNLPFTCTPPAPPIDQIACSDGSIHNLPFICPPPPTPQIVCPDGTVHNLPFVCLTPPGPGPSGQIVPITDGPFAAIPAAIAIDDVGNVWVANTGSNDVTERSPSGTYLKTISILPARGPRAIIFGGGYIWTSNPSTNNVTRIDPSGVLALTTFELPPKSNFIGPCRSADPGQMAWDSIERTLFIVSTSAPCNYTDAGILQLDPNVSPAAFRWFDGCAASIDTGIVFDGNNIWESCGSALLRIEPVRGTTTTVQLGAAEPLPGPFAAPGIEGATSLAFDGRGTLWVAAFTNDVGKLNGQLVQVLITPAGGIPIPHRLVGTKLSDVVTAGVGNVYTVDIAGFPSGAVVNFDTTTGSTPQLLGAILPGALAVTASYIWLIDLIQGQLVRVTR